MERTDGYSSWAYLPWSVTTFRPSHIPLVPSAHYARVTHVPNETRMRVIGEGKRRCERVPVTLIR